VSGGNTYIKTYNDNQAFTSLQIYNSSVNFGLSYTINTISTNGTVQITNGSTFNTGLLSNPISQSADVTNLVTPGNTIGISGTSPLALNLNVQVQAYEIATSTTTTIINNNYIGGTPYSSSFGTSIGYIYTILVTDV
jgi:hypothetical protein